MELTLTTNSYIYQSAKRLAQREIDKCVEYLKKAEYAWNEYFDLKLHDAYYNVNEISFEHNGANVKLNAYTLSNYFDIYCECSYEDFKEYCLQSNIDFESLRDNIGRTSSFYLGRLHNGERDSLITALYEASYTFSAVADNMFIYEIDGRIKLEDFDRDVSIIDIDEYTANFLSIAQNVYEELCEVLDDIVKVADYIKEFKETCGDGFMNWCIEQWKCEC